MVAPQTMRMDMYMLGLMYAPTDYLTLALMGNIISNDMTLQMRNGMNFTTQSAGLGDLSLSGLVKIMNKNRQSLHANVGVSIPTGSIDQRDDTPMMDNVQLAYPMQLGSGTWDTNLGATYLGQTDLFSWGAQANYKIRLGENTEDYTFGNQLNTVAWGAFKASEMFSFSTSLSCANVASIDGVDADLNPMMMPLFDSANSGRSQLDVGIGSNFYLSSGTMKNLRFGAEVKFPLLQNVTGIQMRNRIMATFGLQYAIGHSH